MIPESIRLPGSFFTNDRCGAYVLDNFGPEKIKLESGKLPTVLVRSKKGAGRQANPIEAIVALTQAGVELGRPMTMSLTWFDLSNGERVFVCTELAENEGKSVTNAWPELADALVRLSGEPKRKAVFVEHYFAGSYPSGTAEESFDLVDLRPNGDGTLAVGWRRLKADQERVNAA